jgi:hypothetical protein
MENQESAEAAGISEDVEMWYTMLCWCFYVCIFWLKYIELYLKNRKSYGFKLYSHKTGVA